MRSGRWTAALVAAVVVFAGCSNDPHHSAPSPAASSAAGVPKPAQCAAWTCTRAQSVELPNGFAVSLWHAGQAGDFATRPVVELAQGAAAVQWMVAADGYGWAGTLTCSASGTEPTCVLLDGQGAHSGLAQEMVLRHGLLVDAGTVSGDSSTVLAADLDHDGDLDVIVLDSDFTPNYAAGHLFWRTYQFDGTLASTGCAPAADVHAAPPTTLLTGPCPARPHG